jgi:hypothetical protein
MPKQERNKKTNFLLQNVCHTNACMESLTAGWLAGWLDGWLELVNANFVCLFVMGCQCNAAASYSKLAVCK